MRCPTLPEITAATLALLPRGRAWQTNEGGPRPTWTAGFNPDAFNNAAFSTATSATVSVIWEYWRSFAVVMHYLTQRLCALREEFWCATINETRDGWMTEYGLPDECDPFPDLCTKVSALGGATCEYYAEVAARAGWSISCVQNVFSCGSRAGFSLAGRATAGATYGLAMLKIIVYVNDSPAFQPAGRFLASKAGRLRAGRRLACTGPLFLPLQCVLSRVIHADIKTVYEVNNAA